MGPAPEAHSRLALVSPPLMSRRSLRPQLNQIRGWVRQGRTDAWIAHQLEVTVQQIQSFKREQELEADGEPSETVRGGRPARRGRRGHRGRARGRGGPPRRGGGARGRRRPRSARPRRRTRPRQPRPRRTAPEPRRRCRRDAQPARPPRARRTPAHAPLEGTFDHGEEGYGLWLDPAVEDNPVYAEHWAGHRPVEVTIEEDQIVIRRAGGDEDDQD